MASELASIVQSAHIEHNPSIEHDLNPSTAASEKFPAEVIHHDEDLEDDHDSSTNTSTTSTIPSDIIRPTPRPPRARTGQLPLPDLRFEQTYLASIKNADTNAKVAYITIRDQVLLPLVQGIGYHLLISGWRYWNRGSKFAGESLGAKVRKWWWGVNNWTMPREVSRSERRG
ncbi:hypothetical protein LTR05_000996 [Lithohypha guttulata]|uniref:DUF1770-domain-containing protein n=1 Tax=Lithohypha guttulata TaxID=1690604 RepID=A0AAN7T5B8_9EURO|nr:hypothetical protein LTR05_000996 [Lithohypha guttulata]